MKKILIALTSFLFCLQLFGAETVVTVTPGQPLPFGGSGDFKANGSVPMTGELSTPSVKITSGNPTNGAIFVATNTAGQGTWRATPFLHAYATQALAFVSGDFSEPTFHSVIRQRGGSWNGKVFTPGEIGNIQYCGVMRFLGGYTTSATVWWYLHVNGVLTSQGNGFSPGAYVLVVPFSGSTYCDNPTNTYQIKLYNNSGVIITNYTTVNEMNINFVMTP
jgi:hypothetical protein